MMSATSGGVLRNPMTEVEMMRARKVVLRNSMTEGRDDECEVGKEEPEDRELER